MGSLDHAYAGRLPASYKASSNDGPGNYSDEIAQCYQGRFPSTLPVTFVGNIVTAVDAGRHTFIPYGAIIPGSLAEINAMGSLGETDAHEDNEFMILGDLTACQWDGSVWVASEVPPNDIVFVSAAVSSEASILVVLDGAAYATKSFEWEVKINGDVHPGRLGVEHGDTNSIVIGLFTNDVQEPGTIVAGDVVLVSHIYAASGITVFTDEPVTNDLT